MTETQFRTNNILRIIFVSTEFTSQGLAASRHQDHIGKSGIVMRAACGNRFCSGIVGATEAIYRGGTRNFRPWGKFMADPTKIIPFPSRARPRSIDGREWILEFAVPLEPASNVRKAPGNNGSRARLHHKAKVLEFRSTTPNTSFVPPGSNQLED